jgi:HAD superfamily hydrolase (TIGR01549 family)
VFSQISIIAFDLDDTLWPCMPVIHRAEKMLYQWLQQHYPIITSNFSAEELVELRKQFTLGDPRFQVDLSLLRREFLRHIAELHDYDSTRLAEDGFEVFFNARQQVEFYDDVLPSLARLNNRFRLGAISNGNANIDRVGLGHLFEHAISASEFKIAKPDPKIFLHLADCFGVLPEQILYVGDHPVYDVVGPIEVGYKAVWINREGNTWPEDLSEPHAEVADLNELEALLGSG